MDHRIPGEYAAKYGWEATENDPPSADVLARVAEGLHALDSVALDSESSRRCDASSAAGDHGRRGQ